MELKFLTVHMGMCPYRLVKGTTLFIVEPLWS